VYARALSELAPEQRLRFYTALAALLPRMVAERAGGLAARLTVLVEVAATPPVPVSAS